MLKRRVVQSSKYRSLTLYTQKSSKSALNVANKSTNEGKVISDKSQ